MFNEVTNEATFHGSADFASLRCGGEGVFYNVTFESKEKIDFSRASFGGSLVCNKATFKGSADFASLRCGGEARFYDATFESKKAVNFAHASFGVSLVCDDTIFRGPVYFHAIKCNGGGFFHRTRFESEEEVIFTHASFGVNLECNGATFRGPADFTALKCDRQGVFENATFESEKRVNFTNASFGEDLICTKKATFKGPVDFSRLECGVNGIFENATFESEKKVSFAHASFGVDLVCIKATFKGPANFHALKCNGGALFREANFEGEEGVNFTHTSFGVNLECNEATFRGPVYFHALECNDGGFFHNTKFEGKKKVDFSFATFGVNLEFNGARFKTEDEVVLRSTYCGSNLSLVNARFAGPVDLGMARITQGLVLTTSRFPNARLTKEVTLRDATAGQLVMHGDTFPFKDGLNLRGFTFERFLGERCLAEQLVKAQNPRFFSRDPYLQLERHYSNIGDEVEAKRMHYQGRRDLRENAKDKRGGTKWSWPTKWVDWWTKWLTGYGVRTGRLLVPIFFFLVFGTAMFWSDDSLKPRVSATTGTPSGTSETSTQPTETAASSTSPSEEQGPDSFEQKLVRRGGYSLDIFLPVVNLHYEERWSPQGLGHEIYALVHSMVGWILVPLLVASLAGIIRRQ